MPPPFPLGQHIDEDADLGGAEAGGREDRVDAAGGQAPQRQDPDEAARGEIVGAEGLANRRYLWVPSLGAIFGGVMVFSGLHVWTADTQTKESRAAWMKALDAMAARNPTVVVAGHQAPGATPDAAAIAYTKAYLLAFEEELAKAANSGDLIAAMTKRYPDAGMGIALQIGAKVATGEMKWG